MLLRLRPDVDGFAPVPFAFADPERVRDILTTAGFSRIEISAHDTKIGGNGLEETVELSLRVGPLGRLLGDQPDQRGAVTEAIRAALEPFDSPSGVYQSAAVWIVTASA